MSETTAWVQPTAHDLLVTVRDIVQDHPERHDQEHWVDNFFAEVPLDMTVDEARQYAALPMPERPAMPERPVCGTTACVAGWAAIEGAPPGTKIHGIAVKFADGSDEDVDSYARELLGLSYGQSAWLFSGSRTRPQVLAGLNALIEDPEAELDKLGRVLTVTVADDNGGELWSIDITVSSEDDDDEDDYSFVEEALKKAYHLH